MKTWCPRLYIGSIVTSIVPVPFSLEVQVSHLRNGGFWQQVSVVCLLIFYSRRVLQLCTVPVPYGTGTGTHAPPPPARRYAYSELLVDPHHHHRGRYRLQGRVFRRFPPVG